MSAIQTSLAVTACVFAGGVIGLHLHRLLPESHRSKETLEVVRLGTGMLSVLASLVLGLLIASAKGAYDDTDHTIRAYSAQIALLNETLRDYGATAAAPHELLRRYVLLLLHDRATNDVRRKSILENDAAGALLEHVRETVRDLKPVDDGQRVLKTQAIATTSELLRQRWLMIEQQSRGVHGIVLAILVSWVVAIFVSFGLNAPKNATIVVAFLICSMAIGGAVFLILEMDEPLYGILQISTWPMQNVLAHMNW
ncbi:MAG: hypothetical protein ACREF3_15055 [Acetobacteraceae bacterium]